MTSFDDEIGRLFQEAGYDPSEPVSPDLISERLARKNIAPPNPRASARPPRDQRLAPQIDYGEDADTYVPQPRTPIDYGDDNTTPSLNATPMPRPRPADAPANVPSSFDPFGISKSPNLRPDMGRPEGTEPPPVGLDPFGLSKPPNLRPDLGQSPEEIAAAAAPQLAPPMANFERFLPPEEAPNVARPTGPLTQTGEGSPTLMEPFKGSDWTKPYEVTKGFVGGLTGSNPKMFGDAMEGIGVLTDSDTLKSFGGALSKSSQETLDENKARVPSFTNVRSLADAAAYAGYSAGQGIGTSIPSLVTGGLAAMATANPLVGLAVGALGPSYIQNYGDVYGSARDDKDIAARVKKGELTPKQLAGTAAIAAIPMAALDVIGLETVLGSTVFRESKQELMKRILKGVSIGAISEGSTEGLQEVVSQWAQHYLGSQSAMKDKVIAVVDNILGGVFAGGPMGGLGGAAQQHAPTRAPAPAPTAPAAPPPGSALQQWLEKSLAQPASPENPAAIPSPGAPILPQQNQPSGEIPAPIPAPPGPMSPMGPMPPASAEVPGSTPEAPAPIPSDIETPIVPPTVIEPPAAAEPGKQNPLDALIQMFGGEKPAEQPENARSRTVTEPEGGNGQIVAEPAEAPLLRAYGYTDEQIADMSPKQLAAEAEDARKAGVEAPAPTVLPKPTQKGGEGGIVYGENDQVAGTRHAPVNLETGEDVKAATAAIAPEYTHAQGEANNAQRAHATWQGFPITFEAPAGGNRKIVAPDGTKVTQSFTHAYGYIRGTKGKDGDHLDVYVGDNPGKATEAYVLNERDPQSGKFRQTKSFIGFDTEDDVRRAYLGSQGKTEDMIHSIAPMPVDQFKTWLREGDHRRPVPAPRTQAVTPKQHQAKRPMSVAEFIASEGGIRPDADLRQIYGSKDKHRILIPGLGFRNVLRGGGLTYQQAHEKLMEAGYMPRQTAATPNDAHAAETIRQFLDEEVRGRKHYAQGAELTGEDEQAKAKREAAQDQIATHEATVREALSEIGEKSPLDVDVRRAAEILAEQGGEPLDAYEQAAMEAVRNEDLLPAGDYELLGLEDAFDALNQPATRQPVSGSETSGAELRLGEEGGNAQEGEHVRNPEQGAGEAEAVPQPEQQPESGGPVSGAGEVGGGEGTAGGEGAAEPDHARPRLHGAEGAAPNGAEAEEPHPANQAVQTVEPGAEGKPQLVIPGTERIGQGEQAQIAAEKPLKPKVAQKPMDVGMFGDESQQTDLLDLANKPAPPTNESAKSDDAKWWNERLDTNQRRRLLDHVGLNERPENLKWGGFSPEDQKRILAGSDMDVKDLGLTVPEGFKVTERTRQVKGGGTETAYALYQDIPGETRAGVNKFIGIYKTKADAIEATKTTPAAEPATPPKRAFPSYTTAELKKAVESPNTGAVIKERMRAEIAAREAGTSTITVTPQIVPAKTKAPETENSYDAGEQWWDKDLTAEGRRQAIEKAGLKTTKQTRWRYLTADERTQLLRTKEAPDTGPSSSQDLNAILNDVLDEEFGPKEEAPKTAEEQGFTIGGFYGKKPAAEAPKITVRKAKIIPTRAGVIAVPIEEGVTAPEGYEVDEAKPTTSAQEQFHEGKYTAVARRLAPYSSERGFGSTPEEAQRDALRRVKPTKTELASSAAKNVVKGADKALDGLIELFGGGKTIGEGLAFDEETYAKAKPLFIEAAAHFKEALSDARALMKEIVAALKTRNGFTRDVFEKMSPYLTRFVEDVQSGAVKVGQAEGNVSETPEKRPQPVSGNVSLADAFSDHFAKGEGFPTIVQARKFARDAGFTEDPKAIEEAIELALVKTARRYVEQGESPDVTFQALVALYGHQPRLGTRTSTQMRDQAYSTPVPLAYVASQLAGVTDKTWVLEPTAGNGALLIEANPNHSVVNEINPERNANLEAQGFRPDSADATTKDFTKYKADVVLANPPFGPLSQEGESKVFDMGDIQPGYETTQIDHVIALRALQALKDDGKAVLIIGGPAKTAVSREARSATYNAKNKREFFKVLQDRYNVVDHFTVAGELYERQGAGWPVDVIVIDGRGKSKLKLPAVAIPRILDSWEAVGGVLNGERTPDISEVGEPAPVNAGAGPAISNGGIREPGERQPQQPAPANEPGDLVPGPSERPGNNAPGGEQQTPTGASGEPGGPNPSPAPVGQPQRIEQETANQVAYTPQSKGGYSLGTLAPVNMRDSIAGALQNIEDRLANSGGNIDSYVADALGYDVADLPKYFAQEQVDALALAIDNLERGKGFIIGDQTGIGKGRVNAGIIRWALKNKRVPIFVTEKPNLFSDMYRDLADTGIQDLLGKEPRILATNSSLKLPLSDDGNVRINNGDGAAMSALMGDLTPANFADSYDMIFTNYSQMQTVDKSDTARRGFMLKMAPEAVVIFDESHNAGGQGAKSKKKKGPPDRAAFARELVNLSRGVFYSSATYAKRPDVMDLYSKTDMAMAVDKPEDLADAISKGGVPMQQVVASMLAKAGQYIRRERSFAGVTYDTPMVKVDNKQYDDISGALAAIQAFSKAREGAVAAIDDGIKAEAGSISADGSTGGAGASSTNFTSVMHNLINQMLLAMKVRPAAQMAIEALKRGEKPVLTLANTMESFLNDHAEELGINIGDPIDGDFSKVLKKYLERTRTITIKKPFSKEKGVRHYLTDAELGPRGLAAYKAALRQIEALDLSQLSLSPIDTLKSTIEKAGYKVGEITGRNSIVDFKGKTPTYQSRPGGEKSIKGRRETIRKFNNGELDVVILNQAGSTGISLHASKTFKDQKQRHMILVQPEANIDTHMQMLGRIHRTGQVVLPRYSQMIADIPAEKRPAAVLAKKMASLNASTTASRGGALTAEKVVDFINVYGDAVAAAYIAENFEQNIRLGMPLKLKDTGGIDSVDAMRKVTGRIPLLPLAQQEALYAHLEDEYEALLKQMDAAGENALEAKTLDLQARTTDSAEVVPAKENSTSPFAQPVTIEKVSVRRLGKPFRPEEVVKKVAEALGEDPETVTKENAAQRLDDFNTLQGEKSKKASGAIAQDRDGKDIHVGDLIDSFGLGTNMEVMGEEYVNGDLGRTRRLVIKSTGPYATKNLYYPYADGTSNKLVKEGPRGKATEGTKPDQITEALAKFDAYKRSILDDMEETSTDDRRDQERLRLDAIADRFKAMANIVRPGTRITLKTSNGNLTGIALKTEHKGKAKNPLALSSWKVTIAIADASRQITLPFSRLYEDGRSDPYDDFGMEAVPLQDWIEGPKQTLDRFEHMQADTREDRYIATGNLLGAFAWLNSKGRIANYTDADGNIRQGIITSRDFDYEQHAAGKGTHIPASMVGTWLKDHPQKVLSSADFLVHLKFLPNGGRVEISTDRARRNGGQYFLDKQLTDMIGGDFVLRNGAMQASVDISKIGPVALRLGQLGASFMDSAKNAPKMGGTTAQSRGPARAVAETPAFKRWFGDSKVVDKEGKPLVVYHATDADPFNTFERTEDIGFHFGTSRVANARAGMSPDALLGIAQEGGPSERHEGWAVKPVYLKIENPLRLPDLNDWTPERVIDALLEKNFTADEIPLEVDRQSVAEALARKGYDGIVYRNKVEANGRGGDSYIAFRPEQVKSATGNNGDFDGSNPNIAQRLGELTPAAQKHRDAMAQEITQIVRQIAGDEVAVGVQDEMMGASLPGWGNYGKGNPLVGQYNSLMRFIEVSLASDDPRSVAAHEAYHHLEALMLLDREQALMEAETPRLRDLIKNRIEMAPSDVDGLAGYEVRAIAFEVYRNDREAGRATPGLLPAVRRFFEKLFQIARRVKNYLNGLGFQTAEDIYGKALKGDYAGRALRETPRSFDWAQARGPGERYAVYMGQNPAAPYEVWRETTDNVKLEKIGEFKTSDLAHDAKRGLNGTTTAQARGPRRIVRPARTVRPRTGNLPVPQLQMPHESIRAALSDPTLSRGERLSAAIDAAMLTPSRALWDKIIDLSRLQRSAELATGTKTPERLDTYLAATNYVGRAGERLADAGHELFSPLFDEMKAQNVRRDELHEYLYARHAHERNYQIRQIDPNNDSGSGMEDQEAQDILDDVRNSGRQAQFDAVASRVDDIVRANRDLIEREGLEHPSTIMKWEQAYNHYVPLKGAEIPEDEFGTPPYGQGFAVKGAESLRALGRFNRAGDILSNLLDQTQRAIIRAEKNKVGKTFMRFAQANPSPLYKIGLATTKRQINPQTGMVETVWAVTDKNAEHVFPVKVAGKVYYIEIMHDGLLTALKNIDVQKLPGWARGVASFTRAYSAFQTAKNPEFVLTNFARDLQDAGLNLNGEQRAGFKREFMLNMASGRSLLAAALGGADRKFGGKRTVNNKFGRYYEEWRLAGGKISTFGYRDIESISKDVQRELDRRTESMTKKVLMQPIRLVNPFTGHVVKLFEALSDVTESATRLAVYISAREIGLSQAEAARAARQMTIDFNAGGKHAPWLSAAYAFAKPAMLGTVTLVRRLKSKYMRRAAYSVAGLGAMMTLWNMWASPPDDDDEKKKRYERKKYFEREKNIIIYIPGSTGDPIKIPLGYALQPFWMAGENAVMAAMGKISPAQAFTNWLGTTAKAFNPVGGEGSVFSLHFWQGAIAPTITEPIFELGRNRNWLNYSIHPDPEKWNRGTPHSQQAKYTTNPIAEKVAEWMNHVSGGNSFQKGALDMYPDDLEYAWNFALGGMGKFILNSGGYAKDKLDGVDTPVEKIPFVRRFVSPDNTVGAMRSQYYDITNEKRDQTATVRNALQAEKKGGNVDEALQTIDELGPKVGLHKGPKGGAVYQTESIYKGASGALNKLRQEEKDLRNGPRADRADRLQANHDEQRRIMREAMRQYRLLEPTSP